MSELKRATDADLAAGLITREQANQRALAQQAAVNALSADPAPEQTPAAIVTATLSQLKRSADADVAAGLMTREQANRRALAQQAAVNALAGAGSRATPAAVARSRPPSMR